MTLLKDVGHWLETENPNPGSTLKIIYIAGYNGALPYVKKRLEEICAPKHIKEDRTLENRRIVFEDMEKKNIPDIVIDMSEGDQDKKEGEKATKNLYIIFWKRGCNSSQRVVT